MTIKEVETRTGLARANIRYYEEQGFFSAARGATGIGTTQRRTWTPC